VAADYSFVRRPIWLLGHLVALAAVIGFVSLGLWQLSRHSDRSELDKQIEARLEARPRPLSDLIATYGENAAELHLRRARVTGVYDAAGELIWVARTLRGRSGHDLVTPIAVGNRVVLVDRGWVPIDTDRAEAAPPGDEVTLVGVLLEPSPRGPRGEPDADTGRYVEVGRIDLDALQRQFSAPLFPVYLQLTDQEPPAGQLPEIRPDPEPGTGPPHLSYAVQWFVFAAVVAIGYPVLITRTASRPVRRRAPDRAAAP
jgi:cytochrome oxidase assembly protein ShyY1